MYYSYIAHIYFLYTRSCLPAASLTADPSKSFAQKLAGDGAIPSQTLVGRPGTFIRDRVIPFLRLRSLTQVSASPSGPPAGLSQEAEDALRASRRNG
jgi:hypothetical protein